MKRLAEWFNGILPGVALSVSLTLPALELVCFNRSEFTFPTRLIALGGGTVFLLLAGLGIGFQWLFRKRGISDLVGCWLLTASVCVWLQFSFGSHFFIVPTQTASTGVDWIQFGCALAFFFLPFIPVIFLRHWCIERVGRLAWVVIGSQVIPFGFQLAGSEPKQCDFFRYELTEKTKFDFASEENVIVMVMDCMGESVFKEVLDADSKLALSLRDFICFDRMSSPLPITTSAVPALLSGIAMNDKTIPPGSEYFRYAFYSPTSLFYRFKQAKYRCEGYPMALNLMRYEPALVDNSVPRTNHAASLRMLLELYRIKGTPFPLRVLLGGQSDCALSGRFVSPQETSERMALCATEVDLTFYQQLCERMRLGAFPKLFRYYHLKGAHRPYTTDEHLTLTANSNDVKALRGSFLIVERMLDSMKKLGIYDRATIVLTGDHTVCYTPEIVTLIKPPNHSQEKMCFNGISCEIKEIAPTVLNAALNLPFPDSLLVRTPEIGNQGCRQPRGIEAAAWRMLPESADVTSPPKLYPSYFMFRNEILTVKIPNHEVLPSRAEIRAVRLPDGQVFSAVCVLPPSVRAAFYTAHIGMLPEGNYQIYICEQFSSGIPEELYCLPSFLIRSRLENGLSRRYPGVPPRPLEINEPLNLIPMQSYPQLAFSPECEWNDRGMRLTPTSAFSVRLPSSSFDLRLILKLRTSFSSDCQLEILSGCSVIHSAPVRPDGRVETEFDVPESAVRAGELPLRFQLVSGIARTLTRRLPIFYLQRVELTSASNLWN